MSVEEVKRGRCPACWAIRCLTGAGNVWRHKAVFYSTDRTPPRHIPCHGSGAKPL